MIVRNHFIRGMPLQRYHTSFGFVIQLTSFLHAVLNLCNTTGFIEFYIGI